MTLKRIFSNPSLARLIQKVRRRARLVRRKVTFPGSESYWESRYAGGGDSGVGSAGELARFKAEVLNGFVAHEEVRSVIEFGSGDGSQLALASYPGYTGFDVSRTAVAACRARFAGDPTKRFELMQDYRGERGELALSLDVIYHLVENKTFRDYMARLFDASTRYVIIYSSDSDDNTGDNAVHVKHRAFSRWVAKNRPGWDLLRRIPNRFQYRGDARTGSFADFFIYAKR